MQSAVRIALLLGLAIAASIAATCAKSSPPDLPHTAGAAAVQLGGSGLG
jgi:hypothetical protein